MKNKFIRSYIVYSYFQIMKYVCSSGCDQNPYKNRYHSIRRFWWRDIAILCMLNWWCALQCSWIVTHQVLWQNVLLCHILCTIITYDLVYQRFDKILWSHQHQSLAVPTAALLALCEWCPLYPIKGIHLYIQDSIRHYNITNITRGCANSRIVFIIIINEVNWALLN